jgi:hypothetical protein|tara:strand:+ start:776 stop:898 length:123 start_codon:yes stop_codon:yes gene_type:complete
MGVLAIKAIRQCKAIPVEEHGALVKMLAREIDVTSGGRRE